MHSNNVTGRDCLFLSAIIYDENNFNNIHCFLPLYICVCAGDGINVIVLSFYVADVAC